MSYRILFLLLFAFSLSVYGQAPAPQKKAPRPRIISSEYIVQILEDGLKPYKKHDIQIDVVEDPLIVRKPLPVCHIIFVRDHSWKEKIQPKENKAMQQAPGNQPKPTVRTRKGREYADIVIIPKDSSYELKNALRFAGEEKAVSGPLETIVYKQFGLTWRRSQSPYNQYTLYLGEDDNNLYFGSANLSVLIWFRRTFSLRNGIPASTEVLADAFNTRDHEDFTSHYAIVELSKYGNKALPDLKRSVADALELDAPPYSHFLCMKIIGTPESDQLLNEYARSNDPVLLTGLFQAFADFNAINIRQKPLFIRMVETRLAPAVAMHAGTILGFAKDLLPYFREYVAKPYRVEDYMMGVRAVFILQNPAARTPHEDAVRQIKDMLLRSGEVAGTLTVYDMNESTRVREDRLSQQDAQRIKPYTDAIVNSPYTDLSVLSALDLAMFTPAKEDGFAPSYVRRVRRAGADLLQRLPQAKVKSAFRSLLHYVKDNKEHAIVDDAYSLYVKAGRAAANPY